jgi:hypothetical protein
MTRALLVVFFVGCAGGPSDTTAAHCNSNVACEASLVCTRDGLCLPPEQVRAVHVNWTVRGAPASPTSCAAAPDLRLLLSSRGGFRLGFAPVPCAEGVFSVDRLPAEYDEVSISRASDLDTQKNAQGARIDAAGNAMLDLPY